MAQYNSKHTGSQIDTAVARALPGGAIDLEKAPAGYGLGGGATKTVETDFNNYIDNGVYQCPASFDSIQNAPPNGHYGMLIVSHGSNAIVQDVYGPSWGSSAIRWFHVRRVSTSSDGNADSWSEWEWPEPLMEIGVEYRTTERYLGKPVYAKLVNCGALPNGTIKIIAHGEQVLNAISCTLELSSTSGNHATTPEINSDNTVSVFAQLNQNNIIIMANRDFSTYTAVAKIKYTKTTD